MKFSSFRILIKKSRFSISNPRFFSFYIFFICLFWNVFRVFLTKKVQNTQKWNIIFLIFHVQRRNYIIFYNAISRNYLSIREKYNELNIQAYVLNTMHNLHLMEQQTRELERLRPFKSPSHIIEFDTVRIVQDCPTASRFACSWTMLRYHDLLSLTITFTFETFD